MAKNKGIRLSTNGVLTAAGKAQQRASEKGKQYLYDSTLYDSSGTLKAGKQEPTDTGVVAPSAPETATPEQFPELQGQQAQPEQTAPTQKIDTTQPSPASVDVQKPGETLTPEVRAGMQKQLSAAAQTLQNIKTQGLQAPASMGQAERVINQYSPKPEAQTISVADDLYQTHPFFSAIEQQLQDYFSLQSQRASWTDIYQSLLKDSGIEGIDAELINTKNVIDGTEEDIRNEITKAGGFATESQVLALTYARNKQLIKNYNTLLETRNAKSEYLDKMMTLTAQDRAQADAQFDRMMNFQLKIQDYKRQAQQDKMSAYDRVIGSVGWSGLAMQAGGDPNAMADIERDLGLEAGGLGKMMAIEQQAKDEERRMKDIQYASASLSYKNALREAAMSGDTDSKQSFIQQYGYDPTVPQFTLDTIRALDEQSIDISNDIQRLNEILNNPTIIDSMTGQIQSPFWLSGGKDAAGQRMSLWELANAKGDALATLRKVIRSSTLDMVGELADRGVRLNPITEVELQLMGESANALLGAARKEGEVITGFDMSPDRFVQEVTSMADKYQRVLNDINSQLGGVGLEELAEISEL